MEAEIDKDLIEGIAASAFRTNGSDVDEVLVDHFPDYAPAFIRNEIEEMRAAADFGLGAVPAPAARPRTQDRSQAPLDRGLRLPQRASCL